VIISKSKKTAVFLKITCISDYICQCLRYGGRKGRPMFVNTISVLHCLNLILLNTIKIINIICIMQLATRI
jgi:hypothetical protein